MTATPAASPSRSDDRPLDAVLWDMDGTLADSEPVHALSFEIACRSLGVPLPEGFHEALLGLSEEATHAWLVRECGLPLDLHEWTSARLAVYLDHLDRVAWQAPARRAWDRIRDAGIPQAIVSNSDRIVVDANLSRLGLAVPGLVSVSRDDVREGKPDPEPYLRAAELLGVEAARAAVVEDSEPGIRSGLAAGMTVFVMPHYAGNGPHPTRTLAELETLASSTVAT